MTEFISLLKAIEPLVDNVFSELPDGLRQRVEAELHIPFSTGRAAPGGTIDPQQVRLHWDDLTPLQRRKLAAQWDWNNDPLRRNAPHAESYFLAGFVGAADGKTSPTVETVVQERKRTHYTKETATIEIDHADQSGPKPHRRSPKNSACEEALTFLADGALPPGHGRLAKLARAVKAKLDLPDQQNTIEGWIRLTVKEWQKQNPGR